MPSASPCLCAVLEEAVIYCYCHPEADVELPLPAVSPRVPIPGRYRGLGLEHHQAMPGAGQSALKIFFSQHS